MAIDWLNATEAQQFGKALAKFYVSKLPPDAGKADKKFPNKRDFVAKKMLEQVDEFKQEHKLNLYKKAQLGNAFKWTLKEAGYAGEEIDRLTGTLVRQL